MARRMQCDRCQGLIEKSHPYVTHHGVISCMICWRVNEEDLLKDIFDPFNENEHFEITREMYFRDDDFPEEIDTWPGWKPKKRKTNEDAV
jgi:hypothetical protein